MRGMLIAGSRCGGLQVSYRAADCAVRRDRDRGMENALWGILSSMTWQLICLNQKKGGSRNRLISLSMRIIADEGRHGP